MALHSERMSRRALVKSGVAAVAGAGAPAGRADNQAATGASAGLREKFFGCIAGVYLGSAMGAPVEGWEWERIEKEQGTLDRLLPYHHYGKSNDWMREPGTTEDGVERQKLMIAAILDKQDRVNAEDVRAAWVRYMNPKAPGLISEPFEGALLAMAKTPMPAADIGKYCDYSGLVSLSRSCHPIGLINAGDVRAAIEDVRDVGQLYHTANSRGIRWAEVVVTAIAEATRPKASVDSVLGAIFEHCDRPGPSMKEAGVRAELERGLALSAACKDFRELRVKLGAVYSGKGIVYSSSYANEVVTKAVCIFRMTGGNTWEAMKAAVNFGRDTDCLAAVSAGISGALSGSASLPEALIAQVDRATALNQATCARRSIRETSDGLYNAYRARLQRMRALAAEMEIG